MKIITETARLIIREFLPEEEEAFLALHRDPQVLTYIPYRTDEENREIFNVALKAYADETGLSRWGMFDKITGHFVEDCLLRKAKNDPSKTELGYSIHVKYWGKGLATEMATAMISYGFETMNFPEIVAVTHPENKASQKVLMKAGMHEEPDVFWFGEILSYFVVKNRTLSIDP